MALRFSIVRGKPAWSWQAAFPQAPCCNRIRIRSHCTARVAGGIVEKLQNLPFRANTKGMHGGALDKIIAELKAGPAVNCSICFLCPRVCCEAGGPDRPEAKCTARPSCQSVTPVATWKYVAAA